MTGTYGWTIVQHSAYGYGQKPGFDRAVEVLQIQSHSEAKRVTESGGITFTTYAEASRFEEMANYPADMDPTSLYPEAKGTFSDRTIDGLKIYIPVRTVAG